jgi:hypothetical protein
MRGSGPQGLTPDPPYVCFASWSCEALHTYADSFIDAKGNGYLVYGNTVTNPGRTHLLVDGFQTHQQLDGDGNDNTFEANTVDLESTGYGFDVSSSTTGNVVCADNQVTTAGSGFANIKAISCAGTTPKCAKVLNKAMGGS